MLLLNSNNKQYLPNKNSYSHLILACKAIEGSGKNANGKPCIFPFIYFGKTHNKCTWNDAPTNKPWCSTMINNSTGEHVEDNGHWGLCGEECPIEGKST